MDEREEVVSWLTGAVGWSLHRIDPQTKGRSVYEFWEADSGGWYTVHKLRADQLRWRYMEHIAFEHIPHLRAAKDALWAEYLAQRAQVST